MSYDYVLVGGGLQGALLVLALRDRQPGARVALVERDETLCGNHTWSFHHSDVSADTRRRLEPFLAGSWADQEVRFPGLRRTLPEGYFSVSSTGLAAAVRARLDGLAGSEVLAGCTAVEVGPLLVRLDDGRALAGTAVVDARGPATPAPGGAGYQKFLGLELTLSRPANLPRPVIMDATVAQEDGFRFVYVLPLAPDRLLVEDTYLSASAAFDEDLLRDRIRAYAREHGWDVIRVLREERGVLPLPWRGPRPRASSPLVAGYAGGFFHPATGYSLPVAARLAELVAALPPDRLFGRELHGFVRDHAVQVRFARLLNWLMFRAYPPQKRWRVLERFYRDMPDDTVRRFYALRTTRADRARLLLGRPPRGLSLGHAWESRGRA